MSNLKKYAIVVVVTFVLAFGGQYFASAAGTFVSDWSTIQQCLYAGLLAVFAWFVAYAGTLKNELAAVSTQLAEVKMEYAALRRALLREAAKD